MSNNPEGKKPMKTFLLLICSLALACAAGGAQEENNSKKPAPKKKQAQPAQPAATPVVPLYIGRNDGKVQQYSKPLSTPSPRNLTTNAKPTGAGVPVNVVKQYGGDLSTPSPRNLTTNAKPSKGSGGHNTGFNVGADYPTNAPHVQKTKPSQQATMHHASGSYSARVGSTAGGKKKSEKFSPTPNPR